MIVSAIEQIFDGGITQASEILEKLKGKDLIIANTRLSNFLVIIDYVQLFSVVIKKANAI